MIRTHIVTVALLGGTLLPGCWSQSLPAPLDFTRSNAEGLHIYNVSSYFGYSKFSLPQSATNSPSTLGDRKAYGVLGTLGWQRFHGRTSFSLRYTGSYSGVVSTTNWSGVNHNAVFNLNRQIGQKWAFDVNANGQDTFFEQFLFNPSSLASLAQTPATFDNLAASMSVGQYTNSASGVLLNSSTTSASVTQAALLGSHIYTYGARAGLSYAPSSRWSIRFGSFAIGGQQRSDSGQAQSLNYVLPRTTGGDASVSLDFRASPRTSVNISVSETYLSSRLQRAWATNGTVGISRKMGRNWFLRGYAGSYVPESRSGGLPRQIQTIGGGSAGFTTYGNTLLASYARSGYDITLGSIGANDTASAAWSWRRPRNNWGLNAAYLRTRTSSRGLQYLTGWQAVAGITERLPGNLFVTATYTHVSSRGTYANFVNAIAVDGARITIGWAPERRRSGSPQPQAEEESK